MAKRAVFTICLSSQSPIGGPAHCYELRGCLINIYWPASSPRCENEVCFPWSWRKYHHLTSACDFRKAGTIQLVARFWKAAGGAGRERGEDKQEVSASLYPWHEINRRKLCQSPNNEFASGCQSRGPPNNEQFERLLFPQCRLVNVHGQKFLPTKHCTFFFLRLCSRPG